MADDLSWLNQHELLHLHPQVAEVVHHEQLKLTSAQQALAQRYPLSTDYLAALSAQGSYKDACTFLAYNLHHRMAVWWGYRCVVDVLSEVLHQPAPVKDLSDVAKPRPMNLPPFVAEMQQQAAQEFAVDPKVMEQLGAAQARLKDIEQQLRQIIPQPLFDFADQALAQQNAKFKSIHGMEPMELLNSLIKQAVEVEAEEKRTGMSARIDPNSPIFAATKEIEAKVEKIRQETVALVKSALPEVDSEQQTKDKAACLDAVFAYIVAPDEVNAQRLLELGNKIPDKIEGLLSLVAFWSFGDLMPQGKQVIPTPPGLMSNGLNCLLLSCALQQGGVFNFAQRFQRYYEFGYECLLGKSNWAQYVALGVSLHQERIAQIMQSLGVAETETPQAATPTAQAPGFNAQSATRAQSPDGSAGATEASAVSPEEQATVQAELFSDLQRLHQKIEQMSGQVPSPELSAGMSAEAGAAANSGAAEQWPASSAEEQLHQELEQMRAQLQAQQAGPNSAAGAAPNSGVVPLNVRFRGN